MYPQAAGQGGYPAFFHGERGKFQCVDIQSKEQKGGQDVLEASLTRFVAREKGQRQGKDD